MRTETRGYSPDWKRIGFGAGTGILVLLAVTGATAALLSREILDMGWMGYGAAMALVASAFAGAMAAGKPMDSALAVLGEWVVLLALNAILFDGKMEGIGVVLLALGGGCGAALLLKQRGKTRKKYRRRRKNR